MSCGLLYMGSKQDIVGSIALNFPKAENFYDLFGGGFSVTHYMLKHKSHNYKTFHYNEIKSDIVDLVKRSINGEFSCDKFKPEWISRDEFFKRIDDPYIRICWSFGNNQKTYMFSQDIESYKKSMHMAVVFDEFDSLAKEVFGFCEWPKEVNSIKARRYYLRQKIEFYRKTKIPEVLHQFLDAKRLEQLERLEQLKQLQQLQRLERLQQLEQLEQLERLQMTSLDYREIEIKPNSVVYCDIPYKGTAEYSKDGFDHKAFFEWAATRDFPVYVSEYEIKDPRFKLIYSINKTVKLSSNGSSKANANKERLYWNQVTLTKP